MVLDLGLAYAGAEVIGIALGGSASGGFGALTQAGKYGIHTYSELRQTLGTGSGLQVHHIIEQRFAKLLGITDTTLMKSVVLTPEEHRKFTNAWRALIPYGEGTQSATKPQILEAAKQIYKEFPKLLEAARETLGE
ncbi:hypothetical protein [Treponema zioleckii]|uniref:hypothetical protein n=1 Tax=Treponema zioleckii TaxID=331680 RepID=UPI00168B2E06|nr:hypothetical protein [Treponema zioleckii]